MACCIYLASNAASTIAYPDSIIYNSTLSDYWSVQESSLLPACVAIPKTSQDVANIVLALIENSDCANEAFAIKSGGHAPATGFANIASGLTIDLSYLDTVSTNEDYSVASVGAGATWLDVYAALDPLGKSVAGGRNGAVGVGGLTLGGGISYFSPQVGFTCDTLVNVELVLASGKLVNANSTSNSDLFKVLKGGGNNFGVVTRFDFKTLDISQIMAGSIVHLVTAEARSAVFNAFANIANATDYDVHASVVTGLIFNATSKQWVLSSTPVYTLPELSPPVYDELYAAPNVVSKKQLTNLSTLANETATPPLNWLFRTGTYGVSASLLEQIFEISNKTVYSFEAQGTLLWDIALEPLPSVFLQKGAGSNVLGTSGAEGNGMVMLISALWTDTSASDAIQSMADSILSQVDSMAQSSGLLKKLVYANYAGAKQNPFQSYGQQSEASLYKSARKYDPRGVFQRRVPGGFKLWDQGDL